jgi:STE24 endopeptidase
VGLFAAAFGVLLLGGFLLSLPWMVRHVWSTRPLPRGYQRDLVEGLARHVDLRCGQVLVWDTGNQMSNAAVVGIGPRRVVLLSDALLGELPPRELAAVFAHEAAHVKRHHVLIFLAWSLAFFLTADLVTLWSGIESELAATGVVALAFGAWYLAFGWLSRRFELEADLWSAETTRDPGALASALERVGSTHGRKTGWRHFGTEDRIEFLQRATLDPAVGRRLRTTLNRAGKLGALAMALTLALELWTLIDQLDEDRLRADLRLGHYESAETRLEHMQPDPDLSRALERVLELAEPRTPGALARAAERARLNGDESKAKDLEGLASFRE